MRIKNSINVKALMLFFYIKFCPNIQNSLK